jgi:hypothetical protein
MNSTHELAPGERESNMAARIGTVISQVVDIVSLAADTDRIENELDAITKAAAGIKFVLEAPEASERIVFCAGSWEARPLVGSHEFATSLTILGETDNGPETVRFAPFESRALNVSFFGNK